VLYIDVDGQCDELLIMKVADTFYQHRTIVKFMQKGGRLHSNGREVLQMINGDKSLSFPFTNVQATT